MRIRILAGAIALCLLAGALGSLFTAPAIPGWYAGLAKPAFGPPNWLFAPVWTALYVLMGIALALVWDRGVRAKGVRPAMQWFGAQLALNVLWSLLFFGLRLPGLAFIEIVGLWLAIALTIRAFRRVSERAAWLLVPYLLWVSFAGMLNLAVAVLNLG